MFKPKVLLYNLLLTMLMISLMTGCATIRNGGEEENTGMTPLTAEELDFFNGDEFFNGSIIEMGRINICNQFLSSLYDAPEGIDLFELFYCGSGLEEIITEEEYASVIEYNRWETEPDCACEKISRSNMDTVLTEYMGLTLADADGVGLEKFTYLEEYDAYYYFHGDTNYRGTITFSSGQREGDIIRLLYDDLYMADGNKILTLRERNGNYLFISNQKIENSTNPWSEPIYGEEKDFDIMIEGFKETVTMTYTELDFSHWPGATNVAMYIDREGYNCSVFEGEYDITPIGSGENPMGRLHVFPRVGETAQEIFDETKNMFDGGERGPITGEGTMELDNHTALCITTSTETCYFIDYDGGCIFLSIRVEPEAVEGHGARLAAMARTVKIIE